MCQNVCAYFSVFQVFCIGYIIFEIEKKKKTHRLKTLLSQVTKPLPPVTCLPPLKCLGQLLGNCSLVTIPTSLVPALPKPFSPTPNCPALRGPQPPGLEDARLVQQGARQNNLTQGGQRWCLVPVSISAHCGDAALCCLPPSLGCSVDSVTVGLMGPFYTA